MKEYQDNKIRKKNKAFFILIFSGTSSDTFSGTKFFRYRFRYFFPVPNFSDTDTGTFFRYQIFPIPVPIPPKKMKIPGTGNSRYRYVTLWYQDNSIGCFLYSFVNFYDCLTFSFGKTVVVSRTSIVPGVTPASDYRQRIHPTGVR